MKSQVGKKVRARREDPEEDFSGRFQSSLSLEE